MQDIFVGVEHIGIKARNMEQAVRFYTEVMGFTLLERIKPGPVELVFVKLGDTVVELVEADQEPACQDGIVNHLALKVSDIFAAVKLLESENVIMISPAPMMLGPGRYNFFFRGPSGEKIELFQG
ncbi:MAG: VOC family protein [Peptococcaceae bacterium]|nr:VOC family protein [Peptococcaceae bacterium]